jgi:hypothetical protein
MTISGKYRHVYLTENQQDYMSVFEIPEIGCGYNLLTLSCGNQFMDFRDDIPNVVCKPNSSR